MSPEPWPELYHCPTHGGRTMKQVMIYHHNWDKNRLIYLCVDCAGGLKDGKGRFNRKDLDKMTGCEKIS